MAVVDASVCVALFNQSEAGHARSKAFVHQAIANNEVLRAPTIVVAETAAALSRGMGDKSLAHQAVRLLQAGWLELVPVTAALAQRAATLLSS